MLGRSSAGVPHCWGLFNLVPVPVGRRGSWGLGDLGLLFLGLQGVGGLEGSLGRRCVVWGPALVPDGGLQRRPQDARPLCGWVWAGVGVGVPRLQGCLFAWECPGVLRVWRLGWVLKEAAANQLGVHLAVDRWTYGVGAVEFLTRRNQLAHRSPVCAAVIHAAGSRPPPGRFSATFSTLLRLGGLRSWVLDLES
ncbi:hypothetical protein BGZ61DRAFT_552642 [Ilyonectria robusta]|uniref:uncharacterized protein n=1 Tax=Ilyonectria robusta TaxID=1079257 RepID=UPI001E8D8A03|nr:uncharacterized protein BGZ61DRAFT_552642 [Ilyonectria robusta]KAH8677211.1 hypothetical protein BGZ61DRAFT_552642 [Ilyonectria robusta]